MKPISNYELEVIENYINYNYRDIQSSEDKDILEADKIFKWNEDVGKVIMESKKPSQTDKKIDEEKTTYSEIFASHTTFKGSCSLT